MTLRQAEQVNDYYRNREQKVKNLYDSIRYQQSMYELDKAYAEYLQKEILKKGSQNNGDLNNYYIQREQMWENRVRKQAMTNMYIFIGMTILFLFKH